MPALSERLKSLGVNVGMQNLKSPPPPPTQLFPIEQLLAGDFWHTAAGDCFFVETRYNADFLKDSIKLKPSASLETIAAYTQCPQINHLNIEQFAFIDTETTGLGLGAGVYTFMVGIGRFEGPHFRLAQFFLRQPGEETAQLAAIEEFLAPCEAWVSFNGKTFDLPLLQNRYTLHGWPAPLQKAPHIDLLHLSRRLWKARLPSRALGDLEAQILGVTRSQQDVPGWMVADLYFDYLHTGDARPLLGVFYHNEMDVVSLAALLAHSADLLAAPLSGAVNHGLDLISIGKLYADLGQLDLAAQIYQQGLSRADVDQEAYWQALADLSFIYKKQGHFKAATPLWEQAAADGRIYAHIELAKYHEHHQKDYHSALSWTQAALKLVNAPALSEIERSHWQPELEHRLARLARKLTLA